MLSRLDAEPIAGAPHGRSADATLVSARASLLGERLDLRGLEHERALAVAPLTIRIGSSGYAVCFRYGVVVTVNVSEPEEASLIASLTHLVSDRLEVPETEALAIAVGGEADDQVDPSGRLAIAEMTPARVQVVADILAKHLMLSHYETRIASVFDRLEPLAEALRRTGRSIPGARLLLRQIGGVLLIQQKMVGRVEATERPDVLWENPGLERIYSRLETEYELRDRSRALDRKLELLFRTAETLLRLAEGRRALRLEWYVVVLILCEIVLSLYAILAAA